MSEVYNKPKNRAKLPLLLQKGDKPVKKANQAFINGQIYTMDEKNPTAEAVFASEGTILYVGTKEGGETYMDASTQIIDLQGGVVLPGFIEPHVHVPGNAYNVLFNINLFDAKNEAETMEMISDFIKKHPERDRYYGRGFMSAVFGGRERSIGPRKERLDSICRDKPIVLIDYGGHIFWLNSKALEAFGITRDTPQLPGGIIEKDPQTGELWGILKDEAKALVPDQVFTQEEQIAAVNWCQELLASCGYTTILAMRPSACSYPNPLLEAFAALSEGGEQKLRVYGAREIKANQEVLPQLKELCQYREAYHTNLLSAATAKFFVDGVVEGVSAWLTQPYEPAAGKGVSYYGKALWKPEALAGAFKEVLKEGFNIHIHAIGDRAVKESIKALEIAQRQYPGDHRNTITHIQLVDSADIPKMNELDITACVNAFWHFKDPCVYFEAELPFLGKERAEREFPLKSLLQEGVRITCSADYPITPRPNPFYAIQAAVTRNIYQTAHFKVPAISDMDDSRYLLNKDERVSVMDMVKAYTVNGAYALHAEDVAGSLEMGKSADMMVIDRDIFHVNPLDIENTKVIRTIFQGKTTFGISEL